MSGKFTPRETRSPFSRLHARRILAFAGSDQDGDRLLDIVSFEAGKIQPVPEVATGSCAAFLAGLVTIEGAMIALIDLSHLFSSEFDDIQTVATSAAA